MRDNRLSDELEEGSTQHLADTGLDARAVAVFRYLAGDPADRYAERELFPAIRAVAGSTDYVEASTALGSAEVALKFVLSNYALSKRADGFGSLCRLTTTMINRTLDGSTFEDYLESRDAEAMWVTFEEVCAEFGQKSYEEVNRPVLEGLCNLNFEIMQQCGEPNVLLWLRGEIETTHRVDYIFERLTEIRNLGPKTASLLLRDAVFLLGLEEGVHYADRLYLQPVTSSIRRCARFVVPEARQGKLADWVLAGKVSKYARIAGVSGVRFNMGAVQTLFENPKFEETLSSLH